MAKLPAVAIIGKPNTGKSMLFNRLIGRRKAIVSETPGTTRDRIAAMVKLESVDFLLVDTGGMGGGTEDAALEDDVHRQSLVALENADLILFTVDSREELTSRDWEIADLLRRQRKQHVPVLLVVTKCDNPALTETLLPPFYSLNVAEKVLAVSAAQSIGIDDLLGSIEEALHSLHFGKQPEEASSAPMIAIIGKPNVGKSSLVNAFMSEEQRKTASLLVSEEAGTTRDTTDTVIRYHDRDYVFMDTAGIKRRSQTTSDIEVHAYFRSIRALELCDIAVLVLDATEPVSRQDKRIAKVAATEGKGLIIIVNKIDRLKTEERAKRVSEVRSALSFCGFAAVLPCSATTREGLLKLFPLIETVQLNRTRRIPTKALIEWFDDAIGGQPMHALARTKHIAQASDVPPTFTIFVKDPKKVSVSQLKYLEKRLRQSFAFEGTPIRWITKGPRDD